MRETNLIKVKGTISRMDITKKRIQYYVFTDGGNNKTERLVLSQIFKNPSDVKDVSFTVGDRVTIEGHIQDRKTTDDKGKNRYEKNFIIDSIEPAKRILSEEFGSDDFEEEGGVSKDENYVRFIGKVVHTFKPSPNLTILTLRAKKDNHYNYCDVLCFDRQSTTADTLTADDYAVIIGYIKNTVNKKAGQEVQNIICKDIGKIKPEKMELD